MFLIIVDAYFKWLDVPKLLSLVDIKSTLSHLTSWVKFWNEVQKSEEGEIYGHWGFPHALCKGYVSIKLFLQL